MGIESFLGGAVPLVLIVKEPPTAWQIRDWPRLDALITCHDLVLSRMPETGNQSDVTFLSLRLRAGSVRRAGGT